MTEPTPRDIADARELIEAIREGLGASDLGKLITLKKWTMAGLAAPIDADPPAQTATTT